MKSSSFVFLMLLVSCASAPEPKKNAARAVSKPEPSAAAIAPPDPCAPATAFRAQIPDLLAQGRLDRSLRLIRRARAICPKDAAKGWIAELEILTALSRFAEARELIKAVLQSNPADAGTTARAKEIEAQIAQLDQPIADVPAARSKMLTLSHAADVLAEKGDPASIRAAIDQYMEAWKAFRPNGQALVSAALLEQKVGRADQARRLFDRALVELEQEWKTRARIILPNGLPDEIEALSYSPDGKWLAVGQRGGKISMFDAATLELRLSFWAAKRMRVRSLDFSPDGRSLVSTSADYLQVGDVDVWDLSARARLHHWPNAARAAAFVDDHHIVMVDAAGIQIRDLQTNVVTTKHEIEDSIFDMAISPDRTRLVVAQLHFGKDDSIQSLMTMWDLQKQRRVGVMRGQRGDIEQIEYSRDGKFIASTSDDHTLKLWNAKDLSVRTSIDAKAEVNGVAFSPDNKKVAFGVAGHGVFLVDIKTGKEEGAWASKELQIPALGFSPDGRYLAWGCLYEQQCLHLLNLHENREETSLTRTQASIRAAQLAPDGTSLAFGGWDHTVRFVSFDETSKLLTRKHDLFVSGVAYSPDSKLLVSASDDRTVRLWEVVSGDLVRTFDTAEGSRIAPASAVTFFADGKHVGAGFADGRVAAWAIDKVPHPVLVLGSRAPAMIGALSFSADAKYAITTTPSDSLRLWDVDARSVLYTVPKAESHVGAFSPDGQRVVSADEDGNLMLRDAKTLRFKGRIGRHAMGLRGAAFSPDGKFLVSAADDRSIIRWDIDNGKAVFETPVEGEPNSVSISSDGKWIVVPMGDGSVSLIRFEDGKLAANLYSVPGRDAIAIVDQRGHVELAGQDVCEARRGSLCRIGPLSVPFEVCAERGLSAGLLGKIISNTPIEDDTEASIDWPVCP